jgi:hypothetical protein
MQKAGIMVAICKLHLHRLGASTCLTRRNDLTMISQWKQHLKNYFVAGLLVVIPLATTIWLTVEVATWSIGFLTSIPKQFNPIQGLHPILINLIDLAVGLLTPILLILLIGFMARNIVGQWLLNLSEQLLHAIPIAGLVYKTLKQLVSVLFAPQQPALSTGGAGGISSAWGLGVSFCNGRHSNSHSTGWAAALPQPVRAHHAQPNHRLVRHRAGRPGGGGVHAGGGCF